MNFQLTLGVPSYRGVWLEDPVDVRGVERGAGHPWLFCVLLLTVAVVWLPFVLGGCFSHQLLQKSIRGPTGVNQNFSQRVSTVGITISSFDLRTT